MGWFSGEQAVFKGLGLGAWIYVQGLQYHGATIQRVRLF